MKLLRLRLKNYRGIEEHVVAPDTDRVTIIQGPNEIGKSSFAEAIDLIFDRKDRSTANDVDAVFPVDRDVGPEVELDVETGPYRFTYRKRFRKDAITELTIHEPELENLTGDEAHERALRILEETLDMTLWRALKVHQGAQVGQVDLTGQTALSKALDRAAGGARIGDEEIALFDAVEQTYNEYWTASGNPRKPYKDRIDAVEASGGLGAEVADLEDRFHELEDDVERARGLEAELENAQSRLPDLEHAAEQWAEKLQEVERLDQALAVAKAEMEAANERRKSAERDLEQRKHQVEAFESAKGELEGKADQLARSQPELERLEDRANQAKGLLEKADTQYKMARDLERLCRRDLEHLERTRECDRLSRTLERVRSAQQMAKDARRTLATTRVDDDIVDRLRKAQLEIRSLDDRLEQEGALLTVTAETDLAFELDGEAYELVAGDKYSRKTTQTATVAFPGLMSLEVRAGQNSEELLRSLEDARRSRDELLDEAGVESIDMAERVNAERRSAEQDLERASTKLEEALEGRSVEVLEDTYAGLEAQTQTYPDQRPDGPDIPDGVRTAEQRLSQAERAHQEAEAALDDARIGHERAQQALQDEKQVVRELELDVQRAEQQLGRLEDALSEAREDVADADLAQALNDLEESFEKAKGAFEDAKERLDDSDAETVRVKAENSQKVVATIQDDIRGIERSLGELRGSLQAREKDGLHEKLERKRAELSHAKRELEAVRRRAEASKLLYNVMSDERSMARRKYVRPLRERIERIGKIVFGESLEVVMDEDLRITARTLRGRSIPYGSLSVGAQEQLSILTRVACAAIVAGDGEGVPLLLDDALGYSDPARLEAMGAALATAGRECQVIVLTCAPDRYRHVGGAKIERLE